MERSISAFLRTLVTLSVILGISALGQTSRGTVSGTVFDRTGAVVVGAKVVLKNNGTGVIRTSQTNEAGIYRFDAVDLGSYSLKIDMNGFKQSSVTDISIEA